MTSTDEKVSTLALSAQTWAGAGPRRLRQKARQAFADGATTLLLDARDVPFLDSRAVACVVQLVHQVPAGARIVLVGLGRHARTVARVTGLDELVDLRDSAEGSLAATS